ncbi:MAG: hypothetical protein Q8K36_02765 [Alphaproteobacteria bacterium]|nr:hypothetical protein [Alphaproteobacteria bacterium]
MTPQEKKSYLVEIKARYKKACKKEQGRILDEFCAVCHYHRKYAIRILSKPIHRPKKKPGPVCYYDEAVLNVLRPIWIASDQLCSKRLKVALKFWLPYDEHEKGILSDSVRKKVLSMSASTIDRLLKKVRFEHGKKGLSGTKPGTLLKTQIAIKTNHWDVTRPGYVEADTVAHCGNSLSGNFIWSLTFTDIFSGWTENRATWNKGSQGVIDQIKDIESFIPFQLLGFDCDNGSEFLNHHLWRYFSDRPQPVQFTRSRPYKKNDNAHVEQKNWSHVRQILG